jgi:hypothetical protein
MPKISVYLAHDALKTEKSTKIPEKGLPFSDRRDTI